MSHQPHASSSYNYLNRRATSIIFVLCFLCSISAAQTFDSTTSELDLPNYVNAFPINALGDERIAIYKNSADQYFYQPLLLPDWEAYKEDIDTLCTNPGNTEIQTARLKVETMRQSYEDELLEQLRANGHQLNLINPFPHAFFQVFVDFGDRSALISDEFLPTANSGLGIQIGTALPNTVTFEVVGRCDELNNLYKRRTIQNSLSGQLFSQGFAYSTDFIQAGAVFSSNENIRTEVFGTESEEHRVVNVSSSSGGGFNLNLGFIAIGGSNSNTQVGTTQSDQRILSRDYLSRITTRYQAELKLFAQGDPERTRNTVENFLSVLLNLLPNVSLTFDKVSDQQWNLVNGAVTYATLSALDMSEIQKAAPQSTNTSSNTNSATIPNSATVSSAQTGDFTVKNDITWQYDGENWIPTSVDLEIVSESDLEKQFSLSGRFVNEEGRRATATKFNYPASFWSEQGNAPATLAERISALEDIRYSEIRAQLGPLPLAAGGVVEYSLPESVPETSREVLVFVSMATGNNPGSNSSSVFKIWSSDAIGEQIGHALFYAFLYPQPAWAYNSDAFWLPAPEDGLIRVSHISGDARDNPTGSIESQIEILGFR
jgi:hypothetical protein